MDLIINVCQFIIALGIACDSNVLLRLIDDFALIFLKVINDEGKFIVAFITLNVAFMAMYCELCSLSYRYAFGTIFIACICHLLYSCAVD